MKNFRTLDAAEITRLEAQYGVPRHMDLQEHCVRNIATLDFEESIWFARELEHIKSRSFDLLYQDLFARQLFPISGEAGSHVNTITYRTYDRSGMAKIINSYAQDLPRADVAGKEVSIPVRPVGISFAYTVDEIMASQATGKGLEQRRANAAQRAVEETFDTIAWYGDADNNLPGFLTNPNIPSEEVANGAGGDTEWETKTPDEIIFDLTNAFGVQYATTRQREISNRLLLPTKQWNYVNTTPRASNSDTTILTYVVENIQWLSGKEAVTAVPELEGAGPAGSDMFIIYTADADKLELEIPMELNFLAPQPKGLEVETPGWAKIGGVNVYYPLSAWMWYGI